VIVFHDVSMARSMVLEMSHLAQHDILTDLPNRLMLNDRLTQAISLALRNRNRLAVLFLDLDGFKNASTIRWATPLATNFCNRWPCG
jgi:GGDEF domain-containing protein